MKILWIRLIFFYAPLWALGIKDIISQDPAITQAQQEAPAAVFSKSGPNEVDKSIPVSSSVKTKEIHWDQPLVQDPNVKSYTLKNGFRCYVIPTSPEKPFVSLRLLINAGAAMETPEEDGIAHFIEHMTFNGTEHFKPGTLLNYFRDNGMSFGGDTNAFTGYLYTCFQIDLPKNDKKSIKDGLQVLKDQGSGCLFLQKEIERERGVILSEMRARDSANYRAYKQMAAFLYPQSLLSRQFVIGTEETVNRFKTQDFFSFYKKWYIPQRMSLVIAGPVDPAKVHKWVERLFGPIKGSSSNVDIPDLGPIEPAKGLQVKVIKDPELTQATLAFIAQKQISPSSSLMGKQLRNDIAWALINIILNQRMDVLKEKTPISAFNIKYEKEEDILESSKIEVKCQPKDLILLIKEIEQFHRYIATFAFSQKEIEDAKRVLEGRLKIACIKEKGATPKEVAVMTVYKLMEDHCILSAEQILEHFYQFSPYITPELCIQLWNELWSPDEYVVLSGPLGKDVDENVLRKAILDSRKDVLKLNKILENPELKSAFKSKDKAKIVDRYFNKDLEVECLRFSNNVRVNLKPTQFEKDQILLYVALGSGRVNNKKPPYPGLDILLSSSFAAGGLKQCSICDLNRMLDGKLINIDFDVEDNCYAFKSLTNREYFKAQMELIGAYMLEPGYRDEGVQNFQKVLPAWYEKFANTPEGVLEYQGLKFLTCNDPRFGYPTHSILNKRNFNEGREILTPVFDHEYLEITIVGDFDRDIIVQELRETVGKLPERDAQKVEPKGNANVKWPAAQTKQFTCNSNLDRAIVSVVWPVKTLKIPQDRWTFQVLCDVLENRLVEKIRQVDGDTYSPHVSGSIRETFKNHSSISSLLLVAPEKVDDITDRVLNIANDIAIKGITQEELNQAIKPRITRLEKDCKQNYFWMHWLCNIQAYPEKVTWNLNNSNAYNVVSVQDVQRLAKRYLRRKSAICMQVRPNKKNKK